LARAMHVDNSKKNGSTVLNSKLIIRYVVIDMSIAIFLLAVRSDFYLKKKENAMQTQF